MSDYTKQHSNGIEIQSSVRFFNSAFLIGGASIVVNSGTNTLSSLLDIAGFNNLMLIVDVNQAAGGNVNVNVIPTDPETMIDITAVTANMSPASYAGTGANITRKFFFQNISLNQGLVMLFNRLSFVATAQNATFGNARLWASSLY